MLVREIMRREPGCCTPDTTLQDAAQQMVALDCGSMPVVESPATRKLIGIITDRDIVCRALTRGKNPRTAKVSDCMSSPVIVVAPGATLEECLEVMEEGQIRRIPVVDKRGACCGIVTQAQIARHATDHQTAELVRDISTKTRAASTAENAEAQSSPWGLST